MEEIICPSCGAKNVEGAQFCEKCGTKLFLVCAKCGYRNSPQARFCIKCGASLVEREVPGMSQGLLNKIAQERKHLRGRRKKVAVMFADVSNFTSICDKLDPEEVTILMDELFRRFGEIIYKYEGYIDKYIGDSVMALFGAPVSHENDALRSVLCAMELMKEVELFNEAKTREFPEDFPGFQLSIGINFGEVIAGEVGSHFKFQYTVMGDVVNFAERLQSQAPPGEIYVSKSIYELTYREIKYEELKLMGLKEGIVIAYKPIGVRSKYAFRRTKETPMIGREREFNQLLSSYEEVVKGKGKVVVIEGEAGIGKTKLIYEFLKHILKRAVKESDFSRPLTIVAEGINYLRSAEAWVLKEFLRKFIKIEEGERKGVISEKVTDFLRDSGEDENSLFSHVLKWVLGGELKEEEVIKVENMKKEDRDHILHRGICSILERLSKEFPVILIFDDIQWIDDNTRDFIKMVAENMERMRVMLILVERTEEESDELRLPIKDYIEIRLKPLGEHEMKKLVKTVINVEEIDDDLQKFLFERSKGNPFYLEEHAFMLVNDNMVEIKSNKAYLRGEPGSIPVKIEELILARIDKLNDEERHILEVASVIGQEFSIKLLEYIIGNEKELREVIKVLEEKGIIEDKTEDFTRGIYAFRHILIQRAVYNTLLKQRRRKYHERVAEAIEQLYRENLEDYYELLSYHYKFAGEKNKYLEYLLKSGEREEKYGNYRRAEEAYEEWVKNYGDVYRREEGIGVLLKLVGVKGKLGKYKEATKELYEIELNSEDLLKGEVYINFLLRWSKILRLQGKYQEAFRNANEAVELVEKQKDKELLAESYNNIGILYGHIGKYNKALEYFKKALKIRLSISGENHPDTVLSYNNMGIVYDYKGEYDKALECHKKALKIRLSLFGENHPHTAATYNNIGIAYNDTGEYGKAIEYHKKALKIRLSVFGENHPDTAATYNNIGILYSDVGEYGKALEYHKKALKIRLSVFGENHPHTATSYNNIGTIYYNRGEYQRAIEYYKKAVEINFSVLGEDHPDTAATYNNIGIAYNDTGEYDKAIEYHKKALKIWLSVFGENHPYTGEAYQEIASSYYELGEFEKALEFIEKAFKIKRRGVEESHKDISSTHLIFAKILFAQGREETAQFHLEKAKEIAEKYNDKKLLEKIEKIRLK